MAMLMMNNREIKATTANWHVLLLESPFNQSNYMQVGITDEDFNDGAASLPGSILSYVDAPVSGSANGVDGQMTGLSPGSHYQVYGYARSENGRYYRTDDSGLPEIYKAEFYTAPGEPMIYGKGRFTKKNGSSYYPDAVFVVPEVHVNHTDVVIQVKKESESWSDAGLFKLWAPLEFLDGGTGDKVEANLSMGVYDESVQFCTTYNIRAALEPAGIEITANNPNLPWSTAATLTIGPTPEIFESAGIETPNSSHPDSVYFDLSRYAARHTFSYITFQIQEGETQTYTKESLEFSKFYEIGLTRSGTYTARIRMSYQAGNALLPPVDEDGNEVMMQVTFEYKANTRPPYFAWVTTPCSGLAVSGMSWSRDWNALADNVKAVNAWKKSTYHVVPSESAYGDYAGMSIANALTAIRMTATDKVLTAARYNTLNWAICQESDTGFGIVSKGDPVTAAHLLALADTINQVN